MNKKIIILIASIILVIIAVVILRGGGGFEVASTSPKNKSTAPSLTFYAEIIFSKKIKKIDDYASHIEPSDSSIVLGYGQTDNSIKINFGSLEIGKNYKFTITNIESVGGDKIDLYDYSFTTKYVPFSELPTETQQKSMEQTDSQPLMNQLPVNLSPQLRIEAGPSKINPSKGNTAVYVITASPSGRLMALGYVYGLGYDPSDYEIIFENNR